MQSDGPEAMCGIHPASREAEVLGRLVAAVAAGVASRSMQAVPHLSLLSDDFYQAELRPPLCAWLLLWMRRQVLLPLATRGHIQTKALATLNPNPNPSP